MAGRAGRAAGAGGARVRRRAARHRVRAGGPAVGSGGRRAGPAAGGAARERRPRLRRRAARDGTGRVDRPGADAQRPGDRWAPWYAEHRVAPYLRTARDAGDLTADEAAVIERVCERLPELAGPPEPPARLHGDLWSGNVLWWPTDGRRG